MGWMTALTLGLTAGGAIVSAVQQRHAGRAAEQAAIAAGEAEQRAAEATARAAESTAQLAEYNAAVAELQARDAEQRGALEANRYRAMVRQVIGAQRAGFAAGNIDVGYGSAVDVQTDTAFLGELDALTIRTNAAREAWGYRVEAADLRQRAVIARQEGAAMIEQGRLARAAGLAQGRAARTQGNLGAAATLLNTAGSLLMARYGFGRR